MVDRPILFSTPMVRALLDGRKTQTRRAFKVQPIPVHLSSEQQEDSELRGLRCDALPDGRFVVTKPRFAVGDRLWVRETHVLESDKEDPYEPPFADGRPLRMVNDPDYGEFWQQAHYRATDPEPDLACERHDGPCCHWRPAIHMPRWASRLTLTVTDVRVQRLQGISEADARAEGHPIDHNGNSYDPPPPSVDSWQGYGRYSWALDPRWSGKRRSIWDANPWVVALTFTVERRNIDAPAAVGGAGTEDRGG